MKALVYHGPRDLRLETLADPVPAPGEVLVQVAGCGVCGSDLHGYLGHSRARVPPLVLGHELTGIVVAVGAEADESLRGRAVCVRPTLSCGQCPRCQEGRDNLCRSRRLMGLNAPGGLAELVSVPVRNIVTLTTDAPARASIIEVLANAIHVGGLAGDAKSIAIAGGGALGLSVLMVARERGIQHRLLTEPSAARRAAAERLGATMVSDPRQRSLAELAGELPEGGADVAVDAVGVAEARSDTLAAVRSGGRVVALGLEQQTTEVDFADLIRRELQLVGSFAYTAAEFAGAAELYPKLAGILDPLIVEEPFERGPFVFAELADRRDQRVKVVLVP